MRRESPVQLAMQATRAAHSGRGGRLLLRYVRVQMTCVSSLRSEASEVTASVRFGRQIQPPEELRWYETVRQQSLRQILLREPEAHTIHCQACRSLQSAAT